MSDVAAPPPGSEAPAPIAIGTLFSTMRLRRSHVLAGSVLFFAFVVEAWEQVGLIYVAPGIMADFGVSQGQLGMALSAVAFGMVPGTLLWAAVVDRLGRKKVAIASLLVYAALALASALSPGFTLFLVLRFLAGVAFGGIYAVTFPYFIELLPTRYRGPGAVALSIGFPVGTMLCIGVSSVFGHENWRIVAVIAALAGLWAFAVWAFVPESPYWLVKRGRLEQAHAVLSGFGVDVPADRALVLEVAHAGEGDAKATVRAMHPGVLLTVVLVVSFTFSWGYWGLQTWLPALLQSKGLSISASLGFVALSQVVSVPGYLLAAWLTKIVGRRWVFIAFAVGSVVGGAIFALAAGSVQMYIGNFVLAFFSLGAWGIWNTWSGEVMPTSIRGAGYASSTASILLAQTLAVPVIGTMLDHSLPFAAVVGSIVAMLLVAVLAVLPLPETEGRALR